MESTPLYASDAGGQKGAAVLEFEPAGCGSYVQQRVRCCQLPPGPAKSCTDRNGTFTGRRTGRRGAKYGGRTGRGAESSLPQIS
ncbi:MAG: hypothetical protein ACP5OM_06745 [Methanothrix sp.]